MRRQLLLLSTLLVAAACDDAGRATGPVMGNIPDYTISDGANTEGGPANGDFFFLPPMVKNPSSSPAYDVGAFDGTRHPIVEICRLTETLPHQCDLQVRTFPSSAIAVSTTDQQYQVNWRTDLDDLALNRLYRITVAVPRPGDPSHFFTLGFADVQPVSNGSGLKKVDTDEYIGLVDGRTLPIKFRIERGPRCDGSEDCVEAVVNDEGGRVETETGYAIAIFPEGWLPAGFDQVIVAIRRVPIGTAAGQESSCHGSPNRQYEGCYDFATFPDVGEFALPVTVATCIEPDAFAVQDYLQLHASDDGENLRALTPTVVTIECEEFEGTPPPVPPIGFMERVGDRLLALGARLGGALSPREAHAIDLGRGGLITGFSHVGWILVARVEDPPSEGDDFTGPAGSVHAASVRVMSNHESGPTTPRVPLSGFKVVFTVTEGGGTVSEDTVTTSLDGFATTDWTLGAEGAQELIATAVGATDTATFTAAIEEVEEGTTFSGNVNDATGAPIPGATVSFYDDGVPVEPTTTTDEDGEYTLFVPFDVAESGSDGQLIAEASGFTPSIRGVVFEGGNPTEDFVLSPEFGIDGVLNEAEWTGAEFFQFDVNQPEGGTVVGTLLMRRTATDVVAAIRFPRVAAPGVASLAIEFDQSGEGSWGVPGLDVIVLNPFAPAGPYFDEFRYVCDDPEREPTLCASADEQPPFFPVDPLPVGARDGAGAFRSNGTEWVFEFSKPLNSADDLHDFSLVEGQVVSMLISLGIGTGQDFAGTNISDMRFRVATPLQVLGIPK